jgi:diguanylate cyclase (GGDEF)-like protein
MNRASSPLREERERLAALNRYDLLDAPPAETFDRIMRLAKAMMDMPIAGVCLVGEEGHAVKFVHGWVDIKAPRGEGFCHRTIERTEPLIVSNAAADPSFARHPMVAGEPFVRAYAGVPLRTKSGHNIGALYTMDTRIRLIDPAAAGLLQDLARLIIEEVELRLLAATDALTGAMARRAFHGALTREVARASRYNHHLGCVMIDIDHFKRINDTCGHSVGDAVLQKFVAVCRARMRASDYLGRLGGEEFAVLLPETDGRAAFLVAERLREAVAAERLIPADPTVQVTASLGVAFLDAPSLGPDELLHRADLALYAAKRGGRNRSVAYTDVASMAKVA